MIDHSIIKQLPSPLPFCHSHASGTNGIYVTSGIVSLKDNTTGLNVGVYSNSKNSEYTHSVKEQFKSIVYQLELIGSNIGIDKDNIRNHIIESRIFIVDLKKYFTDFNDEYKSWMNGLTSFPARTTIGVYSLPSNVVIEACFVIAQ